MCGEVDESVSRVGRYHFDLYLFTNVEAALALLDPSVNRRPQDPCKRPAGRYTGHDRTECFADMPLHNDSRNHLSHFSLDLAGGTSVPAAWALAFAIMAVAATLGPVALWWSRRSSA